MKTLIFSFLTLFIFTSADYQSHFQEKELQKKLLGRWKLTSKSGGIAGKSVAAKESVVNIIEFKKGGKYVRYTNGEPMYQGNYQLSKAKSIYTGKDDNAIRFDPEVDSQETGNIVTIDNDILLLADNFNDGFTAEYIKINSL
jgi:hypothetical protein